MHPKYVVSDRLYYTSFITKICSNCIRKRNCVDMEKLHLVDPITTRSTKCTFFQSGESHLNLVTEFCLFSKSYLYHISTKAIHFSFNFIRNTEIQIFSKGTFSRSFWVRLVGPYNKSKFNFWGKNHLTIFTSGKS